MHLTLQCISTLIILQLLLALNVSRLRGQTKVLSGSSDDPGDPLYKARIAHSNACEFIPAFCILMLCLQWVGAANCLGWAFRGVVLARFCHAASMLQPGRIDKPSPLRLIGAAGSVFLGLIMAGYLYCHC